MTVVFDMVVAVCAGVLLAALLFMRRMAEISGTRLADASNPALREPLPADTLVYEIAGPLFFGAAQRAMGALGTVAANTRVVILDLESVPAIDATGLVNLESTLDRLSARGVFVILAGVQVQPRRALEKAGIEARSGEIALCGDLPAAITMAGARAA
jgi:SulP family sulfate permease